jgi:hypothetical protein
MFAALLSSVGTLVLVGVFLRQCPELADKIVALIRQVRLAALILAAVLTACGGGGGSSPPRLSNLRARPRPMRATSACRPVT